ncbi:putative G-type lectin S-receptor-like serine/threonine-protein kinase [Acorus calamus]|uniref:non-specific serine/threonine protein kinase n=1 Tax=Acorus calamus TaxID=4465 RepID=A0AAV9C831_ACOCL|nr:putative G-type lectin S-receptor-like serine/threonine-protein kinase [Acorus calamus]
MDLQHLMSGGEYLYVRLEASELVNSTKGNGTGSDNNKHLLVITLPIVATGRLSQGEIVAVKRLSKNSRKGLEEFKNEVELIARLQHKNLVRLLGWCVHENENILIYEYLPNKSLDKFIFDSTRSGQLDWVKRHHIIEGITQGLLYLHQYSRLRIIHRDMKTSNIFGYMSPEYAMSGLFSEKSDVFSFGVIVLEIITGKRSTSFYLCGMEALGRGKKLGFAGSTYGDFICFP